MSEPESSLHLPPGSSLFKTHLSGQQILTNPILNAGTAFTQAQREQFGLLGLLPPVVETLEQQCDRAYNAYSLQDTDLDCHIFLRALQDTNETLFYALLSRNLSEMTPVIYNPIVAQGCMHFSKIYRQPRGLFLAYPLRNRMEEILEKRPYRFVDVIVATDGERILGIGDQGAGGMGIPIGKLSLYTLLGGIEPSRTLPIFLDLGTNNERLLRDPTYVGWRHERITGQDYWDFIDQFVGAIKKKLPHVLLQWEDFARPHARPILEKYHDTLCTFNDDIQGTAAVALGAISGALRVTGQRFRDQQVVLAGAGSAGTGIAEYLLAAMVSEGLSEAEALERFYLVDVNGLLHKGMGDLSPIQMKYAQPPERIANWHRDAQGRVGLFETIRDIKATVLIGVSMQPKLFNEPIVREMAAKVERPIIFPLSNPTSHAEAAPSDLVAWTEGRALIATGAPFSPVTFGNRHIHIGQCNNFFIFPALGLVVAACEAKRITDGMMLAAARKLGDYSPALQNPSASLLPPLEGIQEVIRGIAVAVVKQAQKEGVAPAFSDEEIQSRIINKFWEPQYPIYQKVDFEKQKGD
jgi:malate dehydrogenase (oxaloacetate-decarboxylating)